MTIDRRFSRSSAKWYAAIMVAFFIVLSHIPARGSDSTLLHLPDGIKTFEDSSILMDLSMIARILDSTWWLRNLESTRIEQTFLSRIEMHQAKYPELWHRAFEGLTWARDSAQCHGTPWAPGGEVRWPFFIRFGPPTSWWATRFRSATHIRQPDVPTFFYWWSPLDTGLACFADPPNSHPTSLWEARTSLNRVRQPIFPVIDIVSFPNWDETEDVWITVGISGDELTPLTLSHKLLEIEWRVEDEQGRTVAGERAIHHMGLTGLILAVTGDRASIRNSAHLYAPRLTRGKYSLEVNIKGYRSNAGKESADFTIPSPLASDGISDLLLVYTRGPVGEDLAPAVTRNGENLCAVTDPRFSPGDTIFPYVEFALPDSGEWAHTVSVYLRPARNPRGSSVRIGKAVAVADSTEKPIARWAGIDIGKELTVLGINEPPRTDGVSLLAARVYQGEGPVSVFESSFLVTPQTRVGEYWLMVEVEGVDAQGQTIWRSTQKRIAITGSGDLRIQP